MSNWLNGEVQQYSETPIWTDGTARHDISRGFASCYNTPTVHHGADDRLALIVAEMRWPIGISLATNL